MKKWNNVYFYSYDSSGNVVKHKVINVVEGTASDHNLSIYPGKDVTYYAGTYQVGDPDETESWLGIAHNHHSQWGMTVNIKHFYLNGTNSASSVNVLRERTGAHELGHVLGLCDLDSNNFCNANANSSHHQELLMGYGEPLSARSLNITYKEHVIKGDSSSNLGGYAICLLCRGRVSVGVIYGNSINELPHTQNGSYILPNGVVVLVDEDIEAYMDGSLVFSTGETE